jgi:hypothetical protein
MGKRGKEVCKGRQSRCIEIGYQLLGAARQQTKIEIG